MSTERLSSNQFTIMRSMADKHLQFDKAVAFNQVMFYSLVRRGFVALDLDNETFYLSRDGVDAYRLYSSGSTKDLVVKNDNLLRHKRVSNKLTGGSSSRKRPVRTAHAESRKLVTKQSKAA